MPGDTLSPSTWSRLSAALSTCAQPANLRRTLGIALVVGVLLTLVNQLDILLAGEATALTAGQITLNFCIPFVVSNVGLLAGQTNGSAEDGTPPLER